MNTTSYLPPFLLPLLRFPSKLYLSPPAIVDTTTSRLLVDIFFVQACLFLIRPRTEQTEGGGGGRGNTIIIILDTRRARKKPFVETLPACLYVRVFFFEQTKKKISKARRNDVTLLTNWLID